jgi:5-methylthioadenosine/S-adenosylhomocysteine deaminase
MATYLGVIGGSSFLKSTIFKAGSWDIDIITTPYGKLRYYKDNSKAIIFVQRHHADPAVEYSPPHAINKKAIIWGLQELNCSKVLAFCSTGTMNASIGLGSIVVPNDFLCLDRINFFEDYRGHNIPGFDEDFRQEVCKVLNTNEVPFVADATYFQSSGPRFETAAEIKLFAKVCDIVGMTSAQEAVLAREIKLPFVSICMVDNIANGLKQTQLAFDDFHHGVASNQNKVESLLSLLLNSFAPASAADAIDDTRIRADKIIHARWVVPMTADINDLDAKRVLDHHSVVIAQNGDILDVLPTTQVSAKYRAAEVVDVSKDHAILPGFINCHTHMGMTNLRGFGDDKDLLHWLEQDIWPAEGKFVSPEFVAAGAQLGLVELLKSGCTCVNDMYFVPRATKDVLFKMGFRGIIGAPVFDVPTPEHGLKMLDENLKAIEEFNIEKNLPENINNKRYDLISHSIAPHAPYTVTDTTLSKCLEAAKKHNLPVHIHLHETIHEIIDSKALNRNSSSCHRSENPISPVENLNNLGFFNHPIICAHMTTIQDGPQWNAVIENKNNVKIAHCPCSNMKLASGFCPTPALIKAGVDVGIGTDSSGSNNSLDMCQETKMAALIAKGHSADPKVIPAYTALSMSTSIAARAIHMGDKIGSLEKGKKADITAVNLSSSGSLPLYDVISHLVYSTSRDMVEHVWINGECIVKNKVIHSNLEQEAKEMAIKWNAILLEHKNNKAAAEGVTE